MNVDQDIKKFFKPMKKNTTTHIKSKTITSTSLVQHDTDKIDNLEHSIAHNNNTLCIQKIKRNHTTTFKVNIIVNKRIYPKHYKGSYTVFSTNKGSCYFFIEPFSDNNINIYTNFTRISNHTTSFISDRKKPNLSFLINKCWVYHLQHLRSNPS
jgi:hypothetical protein